MSQFRYILGQSSTLTVNRAYIPTAYNIDPGNDILAYDKQLQRYVGIKGDTYDPTVAGFTDRYDTNNDIIVGVTGGYIHACACSDSSTLYGNTAASHTFYKLTLPTEVLNGTKSFNMTTGNVTRTFMGTADTIVAKMRDTSTAEAGGFGASASNTYTNYFFVEKLSDSMIGIGRGYYQYNSITIAYDGSTFTDNGSYNNLILEDMSFKATADPGVLNGDNYNDSYTKYSASHKDFRALSCTNPGMTSPAISSSYGPASQCYCNTGQNYSYRSGVNYAGFIDWAKNSGETTFASDGVNGSSNGSAGHVMNKNTFMGNVTASATGDAKKMYDYYYELLNSTDTDIKAKREEYEAMYGSTMQSFTEAPLYAAYIMSHMINVNSGSGIVQKIRNHGKEITDAKGRAMNVTYNDTYVPAYPPEYSALQYGNNDPESKFKKGSYYHPEPYDMGLIMRDDILAKFNNRINSLNTNFGIAKTNLANSNYLGTCAEYYANNTWYFYGYTRVLSYSIRYFGSFHSRPFFACLNS